jgi:hypothetical protein
MERSGTVADLVVSELVSMLMNYGCSEEGTKAKNEAINKA